MRGVHPETEDSYPLAVGSSPHARGPPEPARATVPSGRIIPACAGSTSTRSSCCRQGKDHPRMRGVHPLYLPICIVELGSSPHARGPPVVFAYLYSRVRIIPACAGSTPAGEKDYGGRQDHPRMRGVHRNENLEPHGRTGSSPHARGPPAVDKMKNPVLGIIPACAGSTARRRI